MSVDLNPSTSAVKKSKKRRKGMKIQPSSSQEDIERRKTLAHITHRKIATSSNWQSFTAKQLHLQKPVEPIEQKKDKSYYQGPFRKNRKTHIANNMNISKPMLQDDSKSETPNVSLSLPSTSTTMPEAKKDDVKLTRFIGIDCEMVGVDDGKDNMLARVSLVNKYGDCIYDKFVKPKEDVIDYRTHVSGVRPKDLKDAESFETVQKEVAEILKGRILVGHALRNDLKVLYLGHPRRNIRDTSKYDKFRKLNHGRTPGLKKLTSLVLGVTIQEGEHNSVIDARASMQLYVMYSKEWEAALLKKKKSHNKSRPGTN